MCLGLLCALWGRAPISRLPAAATAATATVGSAWAAATAAATGGRHTHPLSVGEKKKK